MRLTEFLYRFLSVKQYTAWNYFEGAQNYCMAIHCNCAGISRLSPSTYTAAAAEILSKSKLCSQSLQNQLTEQHLAETALLALQVSSQLGSVLCMLLYVE